MDSPNANVKTDLSDKVIFITGCSDGIGKETALELAKLNATIVMANRDFEKTKEVMQYIEKKTGNTKLHFIPLDLADLDSVVECVKKFKDMKLPIHVLINNAGCMIDPSLKKSTKNGYEIMFGTNYLGHFLLTQLLMDEIIKTKGRIVLLASIAHPCYKDYPKRSFAERIKHPLYDDSLINQYAFSKTCIMAFVKTLHEKLIGKGVLVNCCHPGILPYLELIQLGVVNTKLSRGVLHTWCPFLEKFSYYIFFPLFSTPNNGAQNSIYLAASPDIKTGGGYYDKLKLAETSEIVSSKKFQRELWDWSMNELKEYLQSSNE